MEERWLPCADEDVSNYEVSDEGRVRNPKTGRVLKTQVDKYGHEVININGKKKRISNLVAKTYIDPNNDLDVSHKDQNKLHNYVNNLEYKTRSEIIKDSFLNGREQTHRKRPIRCIDTGEEYSSIEECAKLTGLDSNVICKNVNGATRHVKDGRRFEAIE